MNARVFGLGCLGIVLGMRIAAGAGESEPSRIPSRLFDIHYEVNEDSLPLQRVELFFTLDQGDTWQSYGVDEDRQPPVSFHAPSEGLFGFYLVVANTAGSSGAAPIKGTPPQVWAFVDYTPPIVQLHELRQTTTLGLGVLQIRWTAIDTHLLPRPIEISYQKQSDSLWLAVSEEPLANTGRYDWRLPEDLNGVISIRVAATDEGGHRTESPTQVAEISSPRAEPPPSPPGVFPKPTTVERLGDAGTYGASTKSKDRAAQLFTEALALRAAGLDREALSRLREVLKLDAQRPDALIEMGQLLFRLGDSERALAAFETAAKLQPNSRAALRGSAQIYERRRDFPAAADRLRTILLYNPSDAEAWMKLGDIAVYQGDETMARDCYTQASKSDPQATEVIADARKRLTLMAEGTPATSRSGP